MEGAAGLLTEYQNLIAAQQVANYRNDDLYNLTFGHLTEM